MQGPDELFCNYCDIKDCNQSMCNCCFLCDCDVYSFGENLDFHLCSECFTELYLQLQKGLLKIIQKKKPEKEIIPEGYEKITVLRKIITEDERNQIFDRDNWKCVSCGDIENLQIDHIIPFSKGGTTEDNNLQTLCKSCNYKKGNKSL